MGEGGGTEVWRCGGVSMQAVWISLYSDHLWILSARRAVKDRLMVLHWQGAWALWCVNHGPNGLLIGYLMYSLRRDCIIHK